MMLWTGRAGTTVLVPATMIHHPGGVGVPLSVVNAAAAAAAAAQEHSLSHETEPRGEKLSRWVSVSTAPEYGMRINKKLVK